MTVFYITMYDCYFLFSIRSETLLMLVSIVWIYKHLILMFKPKRLGNPALVNCWSYNHVWC